MVADVHSVEDEMYPPPIPFMDDVADVVNDPDIVEAVTVYVTSPYVIDDVPLDAPATAPCAAMTRIPFIVTVPLKPLDCMAFSILPAVSIEVGVSGIFQVRVDQ